MSSRDLLDSIIRRVQADDVWSDEALAEADALVLLVDHPVEESEEELDAFLDALHVVAHFHWARYLAADHQPSLVAAMTLFELVFQMDPSAVPAELQGEFAETDLPLRPMHELWEEMAAEIIEEAIRQQDAANADAAVYLVERAVAGLPEEHPDRPRYTINLATALQLRANGYGDAEDVRRAIGLVGEVLAVTDRRTDLYRSRVALRAGLRKMLFLLADDVDALAESVREYRAVVDELAPDHIDRASHLANLADAGRLLYEATGDPAAADDGLVVLARLRAELRGSGQSLDSVHSALASLVRSRFGDRAEPEPRPERRPLAGPLAEYVELFESTRDVEILRAPEVDELLREAPDTAAAWVLWYRFLTGADVDLDALAHVDDLPKPLRMALDDDYGLGRDGIGTAARALVWNLYRLGDSQLVFRLIEMLEAAPRNATTQGYLGISYDIAFHLTNDAKTLKRAVKALTSATARDNPHQARFLEALGGALTHYGDRRSVRRAIEVLRQAVTLPDTEESPLGGRWGALAKVLSHVQAPDAQDALEAAVRLTAPDDPKRHDLQGLLGTAVLETEPERAAELLRAAISGPMTDPHGEAVAALGLAMLEKNAGRQDAALVAYARVLAVRGSDFAQNVALTQMGRLLYEKFARSRRRAHLDAAVIFLQDALESAGSDEEREAVQEVLTHALSEVDGLRMVLDTMVADVQAGVLNRAQAERAMRPITPAEQDVALELVDDAVRLLSDGQWEEAVLRTHLLYVGSADVDRLVRARLALEFVDAARESVSRGNEPALFEAARKAGEWVLDWARETGDDIAVGTASFRLGTLHLEPYTRFRPPEAESIAGLSWARRGRADAVDRTIHERFIDTRDDQLITPPGLPPAASALDTATGYFRTAAKIRTGQGRGEALRRLAYALLALRNVGEPVDEQELTDVAADALRLLPADAYSVRMQLLVNVPMEGSRAEAEVVATALEQGAELDADSAVLAAAGAAKLLDDPARALALVRAVRAKAGREVAGSYRLELLHTEATLIPQAQHDDVGELVARALQAFENDEPDAGLEALDALPEQAELDDVKDYLEARNHLARQTAADVAAAAWSFWSAGLTDHAVTCVEVLPGLMVGLDEDELLKMLAHLGMVARWMVATEREGARILRDVYASMLGMMMGTQMSEVVTSLVISQAKGALMREALMYGPPAVSGLGPHERDMLAAITAGPHVADGLLIEESLTVAWADATQWRPASEHGRLRNRQRAFDQRLTELMLLHQRIPLPLSFVQLSTLQEKLDAATVLMIHLEMLMPEGAAGHLHYLISHDEIRAFVTRQREPYGDVMMTGEVTFSLAASGIEVALLRSGLQEDPGPALVDPEALEVLTDGDFAALFGGRAGELLATWQEAGKDRLLIAPSGPFHFYPAHLVQVGGAPLADRWKVGYLPNLGLLARSLADVTHPVPMTSIGLDYVDDPVWPSLRGALDEATTCAELFGTAPVLNATATHDRVLEALRGSRYVHIAAHGEHNVDAPAFQVIHLADGGLFAHELLLEDLTGLELVTLSACETGLGRIDRGDNLRGIPAALLLAGVRYVVATMWPIYDQAASCFFGCLYENLAAGHPVWASFHTAQQHTRTRFPQYRDWGAFALMGSS